MSQKPVEEKPTQAEESPKKAPPVKLPFMLDFSLSVSQVVVIVTGCLTALISVASGATLIASAARSGAAILGLGLLLWLANWLLSRDSLEMARLELLHEIEAAKVKEENESTVEKEA